jgi:hypothetical protein
MEALMDKGPEKDDFWAKNGCRLGCWGIIGAIALCVVGTLAPANSPLLGILLIGAFVLAAPAVWVQELLMKWRAKHIYFPEEDKAALREMLRANKSWKSADLQTWLREERNLELTDYEAEYWLQKIRRENEPKVIPTLPANQSVIGGSGGGGDEDVVIGGLGCIWIFSGLFLQGIFNLPVWLALILAVPVGIVVSCLLLGLIIFLFFLQGKIESLVE